jgi:hypothetical protein
MALKIHVNTDTVDSPRGTSGVDWTEMNLTNDRLIFSAGSVAVADGQPIPTPQDLNSAALLIGALAVECPHFFLSDASAGILDEIHNAGTGNKRYVFCAEFDAPTASEPILEIWDDTDLDSISNYCLGSGVANDSFFRGIVTTDGLPGVGWTGSRLAGSAVNHFLWLNNENGALSGAKDLYWQMRITVPASFSNAASEAPVMAIKYTTN